MSESRDAIESAVLESLRLGFDSSIVVAGVSMEPWIRKGDRVWLEPIAVRALTIAVGDVVLIADTSIRQLHRVIAVAGDCYLVKGDSCNVGVWIRTPALIVARATSIDRGGRVIPLRRIVARAIAACSPYSRYYQRMLMLAIRLFRRATS